jgi:hypothetical protein
MKVVKLAFRFLFPTQCKHEFNITDIKLTGIPEPARPINGSYEEWVDYYNRYWDGDWNTKRVMCPCKHCGHVVYAHCGIDII